ncbi:hypothetical protein QYM36_019391 [Artemia franciscana]|nr:hypothetical protein QYM36_019391 [Artemia franciscana]
MAGRGALLERLKIKREESSNEERPGDGGTTSRPVPVGRAQLLRRLNVQNQAAAAPTGGLQPIAPERGAGCGRAQLWKNMTQRPGEGALRYPEIKSQETPVRTPATHGQSSQPDVANLQSQLDSMSLQKKRCESVIRSGVEGQTFTAAVNYIRLISKENAQIYEYFVGFTPEIDSRRFRFIMLKQHAEALQFVGNAFDGAKLYLRHKLPLQENVYECSHPSDNSVVQMKIIYKNQMKMSEAMHWCGILFRRVLDSLNLTQIGRNFYDMETSTPVPQYNLEILPGFVTAMAEYEGGIMVQVDVSHKVLRRANALEAMINIYKRFPKDQVQEQIKKELLGQVVMTRYNNKTYRIDDIDFSLNPNDTFQKRDGSSCSYKQHLRDQYQVRIVDEKQPLLVHRPKKKKRGQENITETIILVPEVCSLTGITDAMKNDFRIMKDISGFTRVKPVDRIGRLDGFIQRINNCQNAKKILEDWGLRLDTAPLRMEGRNFGPEKILVGAGRSVTTGDKADFSRDLTRAKMLCSVDLLNWAVVFCERNKGNVNNFIETLSKCGMELGMKISRPRIEGLRSDNTSEYINTLKRLIKPELQLVVCIFPTMREDRYSAVKKLCCAEQPIASQCINDKTISKPDKLRSVTQKIALQINCKLGGELWGVGIPLKKIMFIGMDTYHDPTRKGRSVVGFVASINDFATRWFSKAAFQEAGQELADALKLAFQGAIKAYFDANGDLPENIILYRDGVGDGMLPIARDYELPQLREVIANVKPNYKPNFSCIVVQKRINTRIFLDHPRNGIGNPAPGSVIDNTITRRTW